MKRDSLLILLPLVIVVMIAGCIQIETKPSYTPLLASVDVNYQYSWQGAITDGSSSYSISGFGSKSQSVESSMGIVSASAQKLDGSPESIQLCINGQCQSSSAPYGVVSVAIKGSSNPTPTLERVVMDPDKDVTNNVGPCFDDCDILNIECDKKCDQTCYPESECKSCHSICIDKARKCSKTCPHVTPIPNIVPSKTPISTGYPSGVFLSPASCKINCNKGHIAGYNSCRAPLSGSASLSCFSKVGKEFKTCTDRCAAFGDG